MTYNLHAKTKKMYEWRIRYVYVKQIKMFQIMATIFNDFSPLFVF